MLAIQSIIPRREGAKHVFEVRFMQPYRDTVATVTAEELADYDLFRIAILNATGRIFINLAVDGMPPDLAQRQWRFFADSVIGETLREAAEAADAAHAVGKMN